jgi:transcription initiation factor IIE alpha subunit
MKDTKTASYVIAPREQQGVYRGYMPLDDTRKLEIRYMPTEDIFSRVGFATEDGRPLNANPREYHFVNQLQSWICEVDIDDCTAEIEVSVASGLSGRLPLCSLLGCQQAYLTDGILLVARLHTIEPRTKTGAPPVAHTPPAQTTPPVKHQSERAPSATPKSDQFLPQYTDELLKVAGINRQFLRRVFQIVQNRGRVRNSEIAEELALPKCSLRLGNALSILIQERLIYQVAADSYSAQPSNYCPVTEDIVRKVLQAVREKPGLNTKGLANATGLGTSTITKVTRYLASRGAIRRELTAISNGVGLQTTWLHYPTEQQR